MKQLSLLTKIFSLCIVLYCFLITPNIVLGTFTFSLPKDIFTQDEEIEANVELSLQNQANKTYYLEAAFKKEEDTKYLYFGLTWNDADWIQYTSNQYTTLKKITTDNTGKWNGVLKARVDTQNSRFTGPGNYFFKLKRFTQTGSSNYWSDSISDAIITITNSTYSPTPTPTLTPTPTSAPISTSTPAPPNPTNTLVPQNSPTTTPISPPTSTPSPTKTPSTFVISTDSTSITSDQSLLIKAALSNLSPNSTYYLKGAFQKEGSSNYFGQTKVGDIWIKNSKSYSSQLPITTDSLGNWTGLIAVMADTEDPGFAGSGNYILKIRRYNASGGDAAWSNTLQMEVTSSTSLDSSPTPTPSPAPSNLLQIVKTKMNLSPKKISTSSGTKIPPSLLPQSASVAGSSSVSAQLLSTNSERKGDTFITLGIIFLILGSTSLVYLKKTR